MFGPWTSVIFFWHANGHFLLLLKIIVLFLWTLVLLFWKNHDDDTHHIVVQPLLHFHYNCLFFFARPSTSCHRHRHRDELPKLMRLNDEPVWIAMGTVHVATWNQVRATTWPLTSPTKHSYSIRYCIINTKLWLFFFFSNYLLQWFRSLFSKPWNPLPTTLTTSPDTYWRRVKTKCGKRDTLKPIVHF